jgi:hypothetical protein
MYEGEEEWRDADIFSLALASMSVGGEGVAHGRAGTAEAALGVGRVVGTPVTPSWQDTLINI